MKHCSPGRGQNQATRIYNSQQSLPILALAVAVRAYANQPIGYEAVCLSSGNYSIRCNAKLCLKVTRVASLPVCMTEANSIAFKNSLRKLLTQEKFVAQLRAQPRSTARNKGSQRATEASTDSRRSTNLNIDYGDARGSFLDSVEGRKKATATVCSKNGHGTGLMVDHSSFILTNAHVVGQDEVVIVKLSRNEFKGTLLRIDRTRDAALIHVPDVTKPAVLKLVRAQAKTGPEVHVMGTPLSESLSHSVTRGHHLCVT